MSIICKLLILFEMLHSIYSLSIEFSKIIIFSKKI